MKTAARVLLRELVVIQPPVIRAEGHVVRGAGPDQVFADLVGGVVIQRRVLVGQAGKTARKSQRRRAVICGGLVGPLNAGGSRNIARVGEVWRQLRRLPAEVIPQVADQPGGEV